MSGGGVEEQIAVGARQTRQIRRGSGQPGGAGDSGKALGSGGSLGAGGPLGARGGRYPLQARAVVGQHLAQVGGCGGGQLGHTDGLILDRGRAQGVGGGGQADRWGQFSECARAIIKPNAQADIRVCEGRSGDGGHACITEEDIEQPVDHRQADGASRFDSGQSATIVVPIGGSSRARLERELESAGAGDVLAIHLDSTLVGNDPRDVGGQESGQTKVGGKSDGGDAEERRRGAMHGDSIWIVVEQNLGAK